MHMCQAYIGPTTKMFLAILEYIIYIFFNTMQKNIIWA